MLTAFARLGDKQISRETTPEALTRALLDPQARLWLDMENPTPEELGLLEKVFRFHPLAVEDATHRAQRPKLESYAHVEDACGHGYYYMVIHGPDVETFREQLRTKELDLFFSDRYLITVHEEPMAGVKAVRDLANAHPSRVLEGGIDMLLHNILDHLVDAYIPILDFLEEELDEIEEASVTRPTPRLLVRIANKKRELLKFRRNIGPQREVVAQLARGEVLFIRESARIYFRDVQDHLIRTVETVELYRDLILGSRDIYLSSVSNNLNRVMKTLTIITVTALPATIITSFYGQNFEIPLFTRILGSNTGFWVSMGLILALIVGLLAMFRRWKWL